MYPHNKEDMFKKLGESVAGLIPFTAPGLTMPPTASEILQAAAETFAALGSNQEIQPSTEEAVDKFHRKILPTLNVMLNAARLQATQALKSQTERTIAELERDREAMLREKVNKCSEIEAQKEPILKKITTAHDEIADSQMPSYCREGRKRQLKILESQLEGLEQQLEAAKREKQEFEHCNPEYIRCVQNLNALRANLQAFDREINQLSTAICTNPEPTCPSNTPALSELPNMWQQTTREPTPGEQHHIPLSSLPYNS